MIDVDINVVNALIVFVLMVFLACLLIRGKDD